MEKLKTLMKSRAVLYSLLALELLLVFSHPAFAETSGLEGSIADMQGKIQTICTPLAIIFLIVAGWQKAIGNNFLFFAALMGTLIMFASPSLVEFISASFGGK